MRNIPPVVAAAVIAGSLLVYFALQSMPGKIQSLSAYVSGSPLEIKAITAGQVKYIAPEGSRIKTGETLLEIDASGLKWQKQALERQISGLTHNLSPAALKLFQNLAAIPESEEELFAEMKAVEKEFKILEDAVVELSMRQAAAQLDLRKLELKKGRLAEDEARLKGLRAEEDWRNLELAKARDSRDLAGTRRTALERRLHDKKSLLAALSKLPADQQEIYSSAHAQFAELQEIIHEIKLSTVTAPEDGIVIKTFLQTGDEAIFGQNALLLASEKKDAYWVTALFDKKLEDKIKLPAPCTVSIATEGGPQFTGRITERLSSPEDEKDSGKIAVKAVLTADDANKLSKLQTRQEAVVTITEPD